MATRCAVLVARILTVLACGLVTLGASNAPAATPEASDPKAVAIAESLVNAANAGDLDRLEALFDWQELVRRATDGLPIVEDRRNSFQRGAIEGARSTGILFDLATASRGDVKLRVLRIFADERGRWIGLRILRKQGGFEHASFLIQHRPDGSDRIVDFQVLTRGELISFTIRQLLISSLGADETFLQRLKEGDRTLRAQFRALREVQTLAAEGKLTEAAQLVRALPEELRRQKAIALNWTAVTAQLEDDAPYREAIEFLLKHHPDDAAALVASIDYYAMTQEYDKALQVVGAVEKLTLPDPYFRVLEASVLISAERMADAKKSAQAAIEAEPDLVDGYQALLLANLGDNDFAGTSKVLLEVAKRFGVEPDLTSEEYAAFVASSEYESYRLAREAESQETP